MKYTIIENWENLDFPMLCTDEDGKTLVFDKLVDAEQEADKCQDGIVIPLTNIIEIIKDASTFVDVARFAMGENYDENNLEETLNACLE